MVEYSEQHLDLVFHALSDSTRRAMLRQLARGEWSVTELAEPHDLTLAGISKHLKVLEAAHFVERTKEGRTFRCRANLEPLKSIEGLLKDLSQYWTRQLDSLEQFLNETAIDEKKDKEKKWKPKFKSKKRRE